MQITFFYMQLVCVSLLSIVVHAQLPFTLDENSVFNTGKDLRGRDIVRTQQNKYNTPLGVSAGSHSTQCSLTRGFDYVNHPSGSALFATDGGLAQQLDTFLKAVTPLSKDQVTKRFELQQDNYFLVYFTRLQVTILHEIYQYLMGIYTNFSLVPAGNLADFLKNEDQYELNTKTLIIYHLINVIEEQANQAMRQRFPLIPQYLATRMGPTLLKNDYGADLYNLIEGREEELFEDAEDKEYYQKRRELYLNIFSKYLVLFKNFTHTLNITDPQTGTIFARHAAHIKSVLDKIKPSIAPTNNIDRKVSAIKNTKIINPPLFLFADETMRAISLLPELSKQITPNTQLVPWPEKVVEDAVKGTPIIDKHGNVVSNQPRAYFLDAQDRVTRSQGAAAKLFINIPTSRQLFSQELKKQPKWLNSDAGIIIMLRACLGDYTALFDLLLENEEILDPCAACIVLDAGVKGGVLSGARAHRKCQECNAYLKQLNRVMQTALPALPAKPDQALLPPPVTPLMP